LGNPAEATNSTMTSLLLLNPEQTDRFDAACGTAGARFVGGLFACLGLVEHEFTGAVTYYGLTPRDSRTASDNFMTQGWFTGLIPITVPIAATSFNDAAYAGLERAQKEFGYKTADIEPTEGETDADKEQRLASLAKQGYNPVIGVGFAYGPAMKAIAEKYPDTTFGI
ncbi:BMP family ABC transporter substrate-binding protein, partial [Bacillus cereus]|nr:BMP family ABC transporter substrate-binding protein [Bacillus cereus]